LCFDTPFTRLYKRLRHLKFGTGGGKIVRPPRGPSVLRFVVSTLALVGLLSAASSAGADPVVGVNMNCVAPRR
jgi:hypothetical protein